MIAQNEIFFLAKVTIFKTLSAEELHWLGTKLHKTTVPKNKIIYKEGDKGEEFYIVYTGLIASSVTSNEGAKRIITDFLPGKIFGEMAVLESGNRGSTCFAKEDSELFILSREVFSGISEYMPRLAIKMYTAMAKEMTQRLQSASSFLGEIAKWGKDARKRSIIDPLTNLYNRRYIEESILSSFQKPPTKDNPCSLLVIDIDNFHYLNNILGVRGSDTLLLLISEPLSKISRFGAVTSRLSGDEFAIFLPHTNNTKALDIANLLCLQIHELSPFFLQRIDHKGLPEKITISIGVASAPKDAQNVADLFSAADKALYMAKEAGKNRVASLPSL